MKPANKKVKVTFLIPVELNKILHSVVGPGKLSYFVAHALDQALKAKKQALKDAYKEASLDQDRLKTIKEWEVLDEDGWK